LGLGATNIVTFAGLTNNGDITINSTTASNGLLYIRRTNAEPFLGLANLIASNNTTISNETLFRVGVAEDTNKSAQFGFRSTNTNGNGVAVFSVFGFNALMMVGADASTNAVIYSGGGTNNEVMTLIRDGATEFARPISFSTTAHAATTRTNLGVAAAPLFKVLTNDFSITNQTNMTAVDGLTISTEAGKAYIFELFPIVVSEAASGAFQIVASNAIVYGFWDSFASGSYTTTALTNSLLTATTSPRALKQRFYVVAETNAGSIAVQFATVQTNNTNTFQAGSYMMAQEVTATP
jgi:hypothetical protein